MISNLGTNCNCLNSILNCQPWSRIVYTSKPKSHRPISTVLPTASRGKIAACVLTIVIWLSTKLTAESNRTEDNFVTQPHIISSCLFPWIPKNPLLFKSYIISPKAKKKKKEFNSFLWFKPSKQHHKSMGKLNSFKDQYSIGSFFSTNFKNFLQTLIFLYPRDFYLFLFLFLVQMNVLKTQKISFRNTLTESL